MNRLLEKFDVILVLLRKYGIFGFLRLIWTDIIFDLRRGVDTYSPVSKEELFDQGQRRDLQNRYVPSTFGIIRIAIDEAIEFLGEDILDNSGFIDFGSGKGKVLIAAARAGFQTVKGIEYSEELHLIAQKNLHTLGIENVASSIHGDATEFSPEATDRVLYFFNPFEGEILDKTLSNIAAVKPKGERLLIVFNPIADGVYQKHFKKLEEKTAQPGNARYNLYTDF